MKIVFATNNQHKLKEVQAMLGDSFELLSLKDIHCDVEVEESSDTFEGNALLKAWYIYENYKISCFSDDSGLEVEVLNNAPGVLSARYGGEQGNHDKNIDKLLEELKNGTNRNAHFKTVLCYINDTGEIKYFYGIIDGTITTERRGEKGFGYDPVFMPEGYTLTFAEMTPDEKNKISHRALAVKELLNYLNS